ncbi:hypothetical protein J31TS4_26430 [Paenibacillus sp. J31TS4]|uniref:TolB family protein n=1 Tax=Paenibacillus sp. J31TS4 TaxID=2807195 RepID=UPI001B111C71|nr:PD40 domain-containing protein [Paenibacillus sp. J31TS4]GIP39363.1 hypothetical protein J31TS4_26430 [Paenibacillus sp. J31TS4]
MDEQKLEKTLAAMKERLTVNTALKDELRTVFRRKRRRALAAKWSLAAAAAAFLSVFVLNGLPGVGLPGVNAAALRVQNQVSFVEIGSGSALNVAEHDGKVYVPVAGEGLFVYGGAGFHRLADRELSDLSISRDGRQLLWAAGGTVGTYDIQSGVWRELLKGDGREVFYEQPAWSEEGRFLYVRKLLDPGNREERVAESAIYEWRGEAEPPRKLAEGRSPAPVPGRSAFLYEKAGEQGIHIIFRETDSGEEREIDRGRSPSVSPDGRYVAYVKNDRPGPPAGGQAEAGRVENVWVADTEGETRRPVTSNPLRPEEDGPLDPPASQDERPAQTPAEEGRSAPEQGGLYRYASPTWSSDSHSVFALRSLSDEGAKVSLIRLDLSTRTLTPVETVRAFEQAVIQRDLDFARSLLMEQPDFFIGSNPHRVSYTILGSGTANGRPYVDVEEYWSYTANPYYGIQKVRYELEATDWGYVLNGGELLDDVLVTGTEDGRLTLERNGQEEVLLDPGELPRELLPPGPSRISSLAYVPSRNLLLLTLQVLQDETGGKQQAAVKLIRYDTKERTFELLEERAKLGEAANVGAEAILVSPDGRFAALDLFSDDEPAERSHILVYDLEEKRADLPETELTAVGLEAVRTHYWNGTNLHFTVKSHGQTMHLVWDAVRRTLSTP